MQEFCTVQNTFVMYLPLIEFFLYLSVVAKRWVWYSYHYSSFISLNLLSPSLFLSIILEYSLWQCVPERNYHLFCCFQTMLFLSTSGISFFFKFKIKLTSEIRNYGMCCKTTVNIQFWDMRWFLENLFLRHTQITALPGSLFHLMHLNVSVLVF